MVILNNQSAIIKHIRMYQSEVEKCLKTQNGYGKQISTIKTVMAGFLNILTSWNQSLNPLINISAHNHLKAHC